MKNDDEYKNILLENLLPSPLVRRFTDTQEYEVKKYFRNNDYKSLNDIKELAKKIGILPEDLYMYVAKQYSHYLNNVGKHVDEPDSKYDFKQLTMGIEVETEHTNDILIAREIAKDHLEEISDYYTRLEKMENEAKK